MCWVSSEHLDGIWVSCTRWTIEIPIYFQLGVDHFVTGSDWSPQGGDCQPYFAALRCQCWNHKRSRGKADRRFGGSPLNRIDATTAFGGLEKKQALTDVAEQGKQQQRRSSQHHRRVLFYEFALDRAPISDVRNRRIPAFARVISIRDRA